MEQQTQRGSLPLTESGFPANFLWGAATSAYQVEGAPDADGKGESIWDRFAHTPGTITDGSTGDTACDSYVRWPYDLDLLRELNLGAYRFSISWPRVFPEGRGKLNSRGLDYYDRLLDGLLEREIVPFPVLYHWDLPQALQERGGWENRDTAQAFADYAAAVAERLGDRVQQWTTLNEPAVTVFEGHVRGTMAPGKHDQALILPVTHHQLLAHGLAVAAMRGVGRSGARYGISLNFTALEPATDRDSDIEATTLMDGLLHRLFLDPLVRGTYPEDVLAVVQSPPDLIRDGDAETIAVPLDFLGVNYYSRLRVRTSTAPDSHQPEIVHPTSGRLTGMGWEVYPEGLTELLLRLHRDYSLPELYITENGAAYPDTLAEDGHIHDDERITYLRDHFRAARAALEQGVPLSGYFIWSLLDNFEWAHGYTQRFGVVYVDYETQRRTIKDSGRFVAEVAETNGSRLREEE